MNRKHLSTVLQLVLFTGLGVFIIYYMAGKMTAAEKQQMYASLQETRLWLLVPVFLLGFLSHVFRTYRWKLLLAPIGIKPRTINVLLSVLIGYVTNLFLPRMGEVAKCTVLARYEKVPVDKLVGSIVAERIFDVLCLLLVILFTVVLQYDVIGAYFKSKVGGLNLDATMMLLGIALFGALIFALRYLSKKYPDRKFSKFIKGIGTGVGSIFKVEKKALFLMHTVLIWLCYFSLVQVGFWSLPATQHLGMLPAIVVLVFGSIGMIATQGGIGAYTYLCAEILQFYKLSYAEGTAFGWLSWAAQTGIVVLLGIAALILLPLVNKHGKKVVDTA